MCVFSISIRRASDISANEFIHITHVHIFLPDPFYEQNNNSLASEASGNLRKLQYSSISHSMQFTCTQNDVISNVRYNFFHHMESIDSNYAFCARELGTWVRIECAFMVTWVGKHVCCLNVLWEWSLIWRYFQAADYELII